MVLWMAVEELTSIEEVSMRRYCNGLGEHTRIVVLVSLLISIDTSVNVIVLLLIIYPKIYPVIVAIIGCTRILTEMASVVIGIGAQVGASCRVTEAQCNE